MTLLGRETRRLTYQARQRAGLENMVIEYIIKEGPDMWFVAYMIPAGQIMDLTPMIDQSIQTFNIF